MLSVKSLIECLDPQARCVMEAMAQFAQDMEHPYVTPDHLAYVISDSLSKQTAEWRTVRGIVNDVLEALPSRAGQKPVMSAELINVLAQGYRLSNGQISVNALAKAWLDLPGLPYQVVPFKEKLKQGLDSKNVTTTAPEETNQQPALANIPDALKHALSDLTQLAAMGCLDPVVGRDKEIQQLLDVLSRRRQNNPILVGEPGVGKTAVVEGLAQKIAEGHVPASLAGARLLSLDINGLQAGASAKGALQERLRLLIEYIRTSPGITLLFVDEAHMLMGAGTGNGGSDAANALKPALARGELRMIAATTWSEYKQYFENDAALARRFQLLRIDEPSIQSTIDMLSVLAPTLSKHHGVCIHPEAIQSAAELSHRYITGRQLPDKAINLLDTACAKAALAHNTEAHETTVIQTKAWITECQLATAKQSGLSSEEEIRSLEQSALLILQGKNTLATQSHTAQTLREQLNALSQRLQIARANKANKPERRKLEKSYRTLRDQLNQKDIATGEVDSQLIAQVVTELTGIPAGAMQRGEQHTLLSLSERLNQEVVGQAHAMQQIADALLISNMQLTKPSRPRAVILLTGPSGTGKTATARSLAQHLFGTEKALIRIQLSEFQESHAVASLRGAPPGYVGYGKGGVLTEAVRKQPYSLVLLDEAEKAHPDVLEMFYQMFDRGEMDDAEGRTIDFRNTVILLTSNVGSAHIEHHVSAAEHHHQEIDPNVLAEQIKPELLQAFKPALLGRMAAIPFFPLSNASIRKLIHLHINELVDVVQRYNKSTLSVHEDVVDFICQIGADKSTGARQLDRAIQQQLTGPIAKLLASHSNAQNVYIHMHEGTPVLTSRSS